jgi:hypothetical protein
MAAPCSSTRSATCRWRCNAPVAGAGGPAGGADRWRAGGGQRADHQRHAPQSAGTGAEGSFREDLFYRLNGLEVALPALRERSDKSQLLDFLLAEEAGENNRDRRAARQALLAFAWPGNVRQRNVLRHWRRCARAGGLCWTICRR